jgi:hypothetical protein
MKFDIAAPHRRFVGYRDQIWRVPVYPAVLHASEVTANPNGQLKIVGTREFGYEWRQQVLSIEKAAKFIFTRNRSPIIGISLILAIFEIKDHYADPTQLVDVYHNNAEPAISLLPLASNTVPDNCHRVAQALRSNSAGEAAEIVSLTPDFQKANASGPRKNSFTGAKRARKGSTIKS